MKDLPGYVINLALQLTVPGKVRHIGCWPAGADCYGDMVLQPSSGR